MQSKPVDWFLFDRKLSHKRVKDPLDLGVKND